MADLYCVDQIAESEVAATNLAKALSEHATATFLQADALLRGVVERVETDGLERPSIERIHKVLRAEMKQLPQLQRLALIDAGGRWITTDLDETIPDTGNHHDREYFRYHIKHSDAVVHLKSPIKSRLHGEWILTISRRINKSDGSFAGVVLAAIRLNYFNGYFQQFEIGNEGAIVLAMRNGTVID